MNIRVAEAVSVARPAVNTRRHESIPFNKLPIGSIFRALRNELVAIKPRREGQPDARVVNNNGLYAKVGHNVSVDLGHKNKDVIFGMEMPCRIINNVNSVDVTALEAYKICHKGA